MVPQWNTAGTPNLYGHLSLFPLPPPLQTGTPPFQDVYTITVCDKNSWSLWI